MLQQDTELTCLTDQTKNTSVLIKEDVFMPEGDLISVCLIFTALQRVETLTSVYTEP